MNFRLDSVSIQSSGILCRKVWTSLFGILLVAGILLGAYIRMDYQRYLQQNSDRLLSQTRVITVNLEHQMQGVYNALQGLRKDLQTPRVNGGKDIQQRLIAMREAMPGVRRILVLNAAGIVQVSDLEELTGKDFSYRDYFKRAKQGNNREMLYISSPFVSITNIWSMTVSLVITGPNNESNGVITATLDPSYFITLMRSVLYTPDMRCSITHGDGMLFLVIPEKKDAAPNNLKQPGTFFFKHITSGKNENIFKGAVFAAGENRIAAVTTYRPGRIPVDTPLVIMVSRDWETVLTPWKQSSIILIILYLLSAAGSVLAVKAMMSHRRELAGLLQFQSFILASAGEGIFGINLEGNVTFLNSAAERITGWTKEELYNSHYRGAFYSFCCEGTPCPQNECHIKQTLQDGITRNIPDKTFIKRDGARFPAEFTVAPLYEQNTCVGAVIVFHDLTERKKHEEELLQVNRALKALSACNKALIEANNEKELLEQICRVIVELGGYRLAWICFAENDQAKSVTPVAKWGYEEGYLESQKIVWADDSPLGHGPSGIAIRTRKPCILNNILTDPQYEPWRNDAITRGYASSASFPFVIDESTVGTTNIYASDPDAFNNKERELLEEMSRDLAFGIRTLRSRLKVKQLAAAVEMSPDWILITDQNGIIEYVNKAVEQVTGYTAGEMIGRSTRILKSGRHDAAFYKEMWDTILSGKTYSGILTNRRKNNELIEIFHSITPINDEQGHISHFVATSKDISVYKKMEEKIHTLAYYDELTSLPNRLLFVDRLKQATARGEHHEKHIGVLYVDVDRFHFINDTKGAGTGDLLLKEIGKRLSDYVREGDTVARIGSDEFAILFNDMAKPEDIINLLEELTAVLSPSIETGVNSTTLTYSVGISVYPDDTMDSHTLLQNADMACQLAKSVVGTSYRFFTQAMHETASEFIILESRLKKALEEKEFVLHYQPYWDIHTKKLVGMEALIRWQSSDDGLVSPAKFIPVLEETGLIVEVGKWVIRTAIHQIREWQDHGYPVVPVSVNISQIQFRDRNLAGLIKKVLEEYGVPSDMLVAEITESVFMDDIEVTKAILTELREEGIKISIDDFGTGYSSLSYLKKLPIDNLKIDISFIRDLGKDPDAGTIVMAITTMANTMSLKTIAEGVETAEQFELLRLLRCDTVQGFYLSRPLPAEDIGKMFIRGSNPPHIS